MSLPRSTGIPRILDAENTRGFNTAGSNPTDATIRFSEAARALSLFMVIRNLILAASRRLSGTGTPSFTNVRHVRAVLSLVVGTVNRLVWLPHVPFGL